jgi:hypothetical protein
MARALAVALAFCATATFAAAQNIQGTVTNGTSNKPSTGAEVTLISLSQGMQETAHVKTDANGKFSLSVSDNSNMPHLVRVTYQEVNYFKMVPPGTNRADINVYDASRKVEPLTYGIETAYQSQSGSLQVVQFYTVDNTSSPARTQAGDNTFELALPENAELDQTDAQSPGGQFVNTVASPGKEKGQYTFSFPLRPGQTIFRVVYHMPYSGELEVKPKLLHPLQQFAVVLPQAMKFEAKDKAAFRPEEHQGGGISIMVASNIPPTQDLTYRIDGNGVMPDTQTADNQGGGMGAQNDSRPGGGLGTPIDSPDPLTRYRWYILGVFGLAFALGAMYIVKQRNDSTPAPATPVPAAAGRAPAATTSNTIPQDRSRLLLEAMKEELFQLELDRQQGRISQDEYAKAKAALDQTLQRALSRAANS